jgi:hypothetical protein
MRELQYLLYAENKRSLVICLQALDAAGKDGTSITSSARLTRRAPASMDSKSPRSYRFGESSIMNNSQYYSVVTPPVLNAESPITNITPSNVCHRKADRPTTPSMNIVRNRPLCQPRKMRS